MRSGLAEKLSEKGIEVSRHTVGRHLHNIGYKNSLPLVTPILIANHKKNRVKWAKKHLCNDWSQTLFSNKTLFQLFRNTVTEWYKHSRPV